MKYQRAGGLNAQIHQCMWCSSELFVSKYCDQEYMVMHKNNLLDDCGHLPEEL